MKAIDTFKFLHQNYAVCSFLKGQLIIICCAKDRDKILQFHFFLLQPISVWDEVIKVVTPSSHFVMPNNFFKTFSLHFIDCKERRKFHRFFHQFVFKYKLYKFCFQAR